MNTTAQHDPPQTAQHVLVDGHVHFYDCFTAERFFDAADANFAAGAHQLDLPAGAPGCLMFCENAGDDYFELFRDGYIGRHTSHWDVQQTAEDHSLLICRDGVTRLVAIAGRQIITSENLEVLALGCRDRFENGRDIQSVIDDIRGRGAIAVLPWGFGKWFARRGNVVRDVISRLDGNRVFLGDNGGRPRFSCRPRLFAMAEVKGIHVLPGSDPLPLPAQVARPGRYGFVLDGPVDLDHPAEQIKQAIRRLDGPVPSFGRLEGIGRFVAAQMAMQMRKRKGT